MFSSPSKWVKNLLHHVKPKRIPSTVLKAFSQPFSAMELSNQLRQVFNLIDANGDGLISSSELKEVLHCLGHENSKASKEAEGMVRGVDCNGDGFIDLDEFMEVVEGGGEGDGDQELRDAFEVFDVDGNGFISAGELRRVMVGLGHDKCSLRECSRMIRGVDRDGDGRIDFEEFRSMMSAKRVVF